MVRRSALRGCKVSWLIRDSHDCSEYHGGWFLGGLILPIRSTILIYWWRPSLPYSYALFNASKLTFVMIQRRLLVTDLESFASICFDVCPILSIRSKYMKAISTLPKFQISHHEMADTICISIFACLCAANPHTQRPWNLIRTTHLPRLKIN